MRELDLDALSAVESQMKRLMQPYLESEKAIQGFIDAHKIQFDCVARAVADFEQTAKIISKAVDSSRILESYKEIQKLSEQATAVLKIPELPIFQPSQFGSLYANILEERETLPMVLSSRRMGWQDKEDIALMVADYIDERRIDEDIEEEESDMIPDLKIKQLGLLPNRSEEEIIVVVNGDYKRIFKARYRKYWDLLVRVAEGERFRHKEIRGALDYFNTNGRCPLYAQGGYELTRILGIDHDFVVFKVSVEILTQKAFQTRRNKVT